MEWVKARHTSNRRSKCGYIGAIHAECKKARQGKIFKCPKCDFQLDADLNAARNIRIAPRSSIPPSLNVVAGGLPDGPPEDTSVLA
ncbi:MAG: zinc ribbon domain-containing protein [Promethearchaeota archaeon]